MKKITLGIVTLCLLLTAQPYQSLASINTAPTSVICPNPSETEQTDVLLKRLNQINEMDKSNLNASQKRSLRIEVRSIKNKTKAGGGGIYISAGAVILIIILLIILF